MKKLLVFEMDEFFNWIKNTAKDISIEQITTSIKQEVSDGEKIVIDCIDLKIKKTLDFTINSITDKVGYSEIKEDIDDDFIIASIELTDLVGVISENIGERVIESYEIFEANFDENFKEHIAFHVA